MINSKLIQLLRGLSESEIRDLEPFLQSPFHNKNPLIVKLYKALVRYAPGFAGDGLKKEDTAELLFPKSEKDKIRKLQYVMSGFVKLVENYMLLKELQEETNEQQFLLLKAYKRRSLDKFFFKKANDFDQALDKSAFRDIEYFFLKYKLNNTILTHPSTEKVSKKVTGYKETFEYLDNFYLGSKFLQAIVTYDRAQTFGKEEDFFFKKELLALIQRAEEEDIPLFKIYKLLMQGALEEGEVKKVQLYFELKEEVQNNLSLFREPYREDLVICVLNFATRLHRQGAKDFDREVFEFYKLLLDDYYADKQGLLQSSVFINVIILACELGEQVWGEAFIAKGGQLLDEEEQQLMAALAKAYLHCSNGDYPQALICLRGMEYPNAYYACLAKFLSVRCFYEMEEEELLYTFLKTFENFIRRHTQLSENRKTPILHFIKFTRKLYSNKYQKKHSPQELLVQLKEISSISWSSWLRKEIAAQKSQGYQ